MVASAVPSLPPLAFSDDEGCSTPTPGGFCELGESSPIGDALLARKRARELSVAQGRLSERQEPLIESSPVGAALLARKRAWAFQAGRSFGSFSDRDDRSPVEIAPVDRFPDFEQ
jgi:hypothetical protein